MKSNSTIFKGLTVELKKNDAGMKMRGAFKALDKVSKQYKSKALLPIIKKVKLYIKKSDMSNLAKLYSYMLLKLNKRHKTINPGSKMSMRCSRGGARSKKKSKKQSRKQPRKQSRRHKSKQPHTSSLIPASPIINYTPQAPNANMTIKQMPNNSPNMPIILPPPTLKNERSPEILGLTAIAFIIIMYIISLINKA